MATSNRSNLQQFIHRIGSRSMLTREEQDAIRDLPVQAEQVHSNCDFVTLGESVDHASLVVAGIVARFSQTSEAGRQITALHLQGDMANLHSVVQPGATSALQALSTATILRIPHKALRAATARHPALAEAFWRDTAIDAAVTAEWVINIGRRDAQQRIAHLLCEVATRLGVAPSRHSVLFPFAVTQFQIADATGLTAVHVNRTLQALRRSGLVDVAHQNVWIPDWEALVEVADFDPSYLQIGIKDQPMRIMAAC